MIAYFNKWLLVGSFAFIPYLSVQATSESLDGMDLQSAVSLNTSSRLNAEQIEELVSAFLSNQTVYFHDYTFATLRGLPFEFSADDLGSTLVSVSYFSQFLASNDPVLAQQLITLFDNYITAGSTYVLDLSSTLNPADPLVVADLQAWLAAATQLGIGLNQINPKIIKLSEIQPLLAQYTTYQANVANYLLATANDNPDYTLASYSYDQARVLVNRKIEPLLTRAVIANSRLR